MKRVIIGLLVVVMVLSSFASAESEKIKVEVNNREIIFDIDPVISEGRTIVPLRAIFESLGLVVSWDGATKTVTVKNNETEIKLKIEDLSAMVNGQVVALDVPARIFNGRTMVPARFIGQAIGGEVNWDENTKTISIDKTLLGEQEYKTTLTYSNLVDRKSQDEVRKAMESAGFLSKNIDSFFQDVNRFNSAVEEVSLVEEGFVTVDNLEPEYDWVELMEKWDAEYPTFIGYNCRIVSYDLMKDAIDIGKVDTRNSDWMVFDENALEYNPIEVFTKEEHQDFKSLFSYVPTELTKDVSLHLENVKEDWKSKEIEFSDADKRSIISVFFHDEEGYLFIGHMGVLIPSQNGELLFIEKLSFHQPYQAVKFDNRTELNDYLMNKYDISWGQETAKPFIMENDQLLQGYREKPIKLESKPNE